MVYHIYTKGENIDAEFGQMLNFTRILKGKYSSALKAAEECLSLLHIGYVFVEQDGKPVYMATKDLDTIERKEVGNE
jgi:hypothetical protein